MPRRVDILSSAALTSIYATINELRRTWQIQYVTAARPGDQIHVKVTAPGYGSASSTGTLAGTALRSSGPSNLGFLIAFALAAFVVGVLLYRPVANALSSRVGRTNDFDQ